MNDEQNDIALYVRCLAGHVRALPLRDAVHFLRGALAVGGENSAVEELRGTYRDLSSADDQLEQIADPLRRDQRGEEI